MELSHTRSAARAVFGNKNDIEQRFRLVDEWLVARKVKGERGMTYHLARAWRDLKAPEKRPVVLYTLVPGRSKIKALREELRIEPQTLVNIEETPMRRLLAALMMAFYKKEYGLPDWADSREWRSNLRLAKQRLKGKPKTILQDLALIRAAIIPHVRINGGLRRIVCRYCRTPTLVGYVLDGKKITRRFTFSKKTQERNRFCGDACKMKWRRRLPE
jgi:hypothetical protein